MKNDNVTDRRAERRAGGACTVGEYLVFALIFLLFLAALRALDIFRASMEADVLSDKTLTSVMGIAGSLLSTLAVGAAGGALIFAAINGNGAAPYAGAALFSSALLADRAFYVVYNVLTKEKSFLPEAGAASYIRVASDALSVVVSFFAVALIVTALKKKRKDDASLPMKGAAVFAAVLTLLQTAYQSYVTIVFHMTYDDVTPLERSQIAGDYIFIVLKYGVVIFGVAYAAYKLLDKRENKKEERKISENGDN